jgi:3-hydroxyisobutyrate dehydrogenase
MLKHGRHVRAEWCRARGEPDSLLVQRRGIVNVGIAGTGRMGAAIATRLLGQGHTVTIWNRTPAKLAPLVTAGAKAADSPAGVAAASEAIITILTDAAAIEATYHDRSGLLAGDVKGNLFIEMSTVQPETEQALAEKVRAKGAAMVECLGRTTGPARDGSSSPAGATDADFARAKPLLEQMCRRSEHVGPAGAGARMKLAINLPLLVYWQAFGEALALVQPLKLDPKRVIDIFADTSGGPNVLKARGSVVAAALEGKDTGPAGFDIDSMRKDLRTMVAAGEALGVEMPVTARALEAFEHAAAAGFGQRDGRPAHTGIARRAAPLIWPSGSKLPSFPRSPRTGRSGRSSATNRCACTTSAARSTPHTTRVLTGRRASRMASSTTTRSSARCTRGCSGSRPGRRSGRRAPSTSASIG